MEQLLETNQTNICQLVQAYYGGNAATLTQLLNTRTALIKNSLAGKNDQPSLAGNTQAIVQELVALNPDGQNQFESLQSYLTQEEKDVEREGLLWSQKNYSTAAQLFMQQLQTATQVADEFNAAITRQFPGRF